ncbi:MAG: pilus assembly protein PilP [Pseudomonadota bacterium]
MAQRCCNAFLLHRATWLSLALGLSACASNDLEDLQRFVHETKSKFKGQVAVLPDVSNYQRYDYHTGKLRDPFRFAPVSVTVAPRAGGPSPDLKRNREDLEKYPLDALQMVGVLRKDGEIWALVKAPEGTIHRVKRGNYIGQNFGKIDSIGENKIEIIEMIANTSSGWTKHRNALVLNRNSQQ